MMKVKYMMLVLFYLFSQINSLANTKQNIIHYNAELPKICQLSKGNILLLSSGTHQQKTNICKFAKNAEILNLNSTINTGYTSSAQIVESEIENRNESEYFLFHHNKQNLQGRQPYEYTSSFKDNGYDFNIATRNTSLYQQISAVSLTNGRIFVAGIKGTGEYQYIETFLDFNIYNTHTKNYEKGFSLRVHSNYISCFEQKQDDVYCVYVSYEDIFVSKLKIKHMKITEEGLENTNEETIIKIFYTSFNYVKAIRFNDEEALILFQIGNNVVDEENPYGNSGKDLYFYHISTASGKILVKRYEYLFNDCLYQKDPEYYNIDIIALSPKRIYAVCEYQENIFKGFAIYTDTKKIDRFNFNNFGGSSFSTPVFGKFDKNLAIFYTQGDEYLNKRVAYQMINYPDCDDYPDQILLPLYDVRVISLLGKVYMINAYPANRQDEPIKVRITKADGAVITNDETKEKIELNVDFDPKTTLKIESLSTIEEYSIEFTATRQDPLDGLILGKTCQIKIKTPSCLEQCKSCYQKGTPEHHYCFGCKNETYYKEDDSFTKYLVNYFPYKEPHNCRDCDIACKTCYGTFIFTPEPTTNCRVCNYTYDYFPFEDEMRTCISEGTKDYWKKYYGPMYLDKSGGSRKEDWIWRKCHPNCAECENGGDDFNNNCTLCKENYCFKCDQVEGDGIPGNCYSGLIGHGFYSKIVGRHKKCCPCFEHCEKCDNDTICNKCDEDYFLTPPHDECVDKCDYCLVPDKNLGECINCKEYYEKKNGKAKYTLNDTCVDDIPLMEIIPGKYHIEDEKCNKLIGCHEGCHKCDPWYSDNCTECKKDYYKQDLFEVTPKPDVFKCFTKDQCHGIAKYSPNPSYRVGGVAIIENNEKVCLNCRLRNDSFRQPENKFYCGEKINRTFVDIEEYNKLTECYFRCSQCNDLGNACFMNCTACRDGAHYELFKYNNEAGNCYRKAHKCGLFPYYHDYDKAVRIGKSDDNCGEDCDVCLTNFTCTPKFPFFVLETHECVEYCPITEVLQENCVMNDSTAVLYLLKNPFGLRNPYGSINDVVYIKDFINSGFFKYFKKAYPEIDESLIQNYIGGNGNIYNLKESQVIVGNNISIELTSFKLELEKLEKILSGGGDEGDKNRSIVVMSECEEILKKKYGIPAEEDLLIVKGDFIEKLSEGLVDYLGTNVEYQVFSTSLGAFLPLNACQEEGATVSVTNPFNTYSLSTQFQSKIVAGVDSGYDLFDVNSPFFNDICTPFTNENGNDVLLDDRRKDYFDEYINLCGTECKFVGYNADARVYTCMCNVKPTPGEAAGEYTGEYKTNEMPENFRKMVSKWSNIGVFKCSSQAFSSEGQKKNFGSYILLAGLAGCIGVIVFHFIKEKGLLNQILNDLSGSNSQANPPNPKGKSEKKSEGSHSHSHHSDNKKKEERKKKEDSKKEEDNKRKEETRKRERQVKVDNKHAKSSNEPVSKPETDPKDKKIKLDLVIKEDKLNYAPYDMALEKDQRSFLRYYWPLLKNKQLFIFTFYTSEDNILRSSKIVLFILFVAFYFAFTALFFNDKIMRIMYIYKGNTNAAVHVPNIIFSSLCCLIMNFIVRFVSLSERDITKIRFEENAEQRIVLIEQTKRKSKLKLYILYSLSVILITICWYYVSAFIAIFKNSQGRYLLNVFISFLVCNLWPCVICLIPAFLRQKALKSYSEKLYTWSQILSFF